MNSKFLRFAAIALLLAMPFAAASQLAAADYMKTVTEMGPFSIQGMEQPGRTDTAEVWLETDRSAMISAEGQTFVLRGDLGEMYFIDGTKKSYVKVPIDFMSKLDQAIAESHGDSAADQAKAMTQSLFDNMEVTVVATDSTKKVGKWNARLYDITIAMPMGNVYTKSWNSTDINIDVAMYQSVANAVMASMPGFEKMLAKMSQLKGATVESVSTMNMGGAEVVTTSRLIEYAKKDAPADVFEIPEGYTEDPAGLGGMMGGY